MRLHQQSTRLVEAGLSIDDGSLGEIVMGQVIFLLYALGKGRMLSFTNR